MKHSTVTPRRAWLIFVNCIACQICAGHVYWIPSLGQGLMTNLQFSELQLTLLLTALNAGIFFGFFTGMVYDRVGARKTACLGAMLGSLAYALLGLLVRVQAKGAFLFAALLAMCTLWSSMFVFGASMTVVAAHFPEKSRGRVMGFHSAMFAMSSGVIGMLQAAFFPSTKDTESLLYFVATLTAVPCVIAFFLFPDGPSTDNSTNGEQAPLLYRRDDGVVQHRSFYDDNLLAVAYAIAFVSVIVLQLGSAATWNHESAIHLLQLPWFPPTIRGEVVCACLLILLLASFTLLPFGISNSTITHSLSPDLEDLPEDHPEPTRMPFANVLRDFRFQLLLLVFVIVPGFCTTTVLIQVSPMAAARLFPTHHNESIPTSLGTAETVSRAVQSLIVAFCSCNLLGRLVAGSISDIGGSAKRRHSWQLRLLEIDGAVMALAALGIAFAPSRALIIAFGLVGLAQGTFFAITPTLLSNWFGVDGFPLNFAVLCLGITVASLSISSWIATAVANFVMKTNWVDVQVTATQSQRFCSGTLCFGPVFSLIAAMCLSSVVALVMMHKRIVSTD